MPNERTRVCLGTILSLALFSVLLTDSHADVGGVPNQHSLSTITVCWESDTEVCVTSEKELSNVTLFCDGVEHKADDLDELGTGSTGLFACADESGDPSGEDIDPPVGVKSGSEKGLTFVPVNCETEEAVSPCEGLEPILSGVEADEEDDTDTTDEIPL